MIRFDNVGKAFRSRRNKQQLVWPIRHFSATIAKGESTAILAPPGSGKTTLIDMIGGTEMPTEGEIIRTGHISWSAGFRGVMSNKMTARQNLRFLTDSYGHDFKAAYDFVQDFTELGRQMDQPLKNYGNEQKARLAIAMLLAMNFEFMIVDDNFEAGDANFRLKLAQFIEDNTDRLTLFIATSQPRLARRYCKRAGLLVDGTVTFYDDVDEAVVAYKHLVGNAQYNLAMSDDA